jgi:hypothetical protein
VKVIGITSTAILSLLLGMAAPAYAQHEQQGDKQDRPQDERSKHRQAKPEQHDQGQRQDQKKHREHAQQQQQDQNRHHEHAQQQQRQDRNRPEEHAYQGRGNESRHAEDRHRVQHSAWQQHRSQHWDSDHRNWRQRGGYRGYRIPEDRFRGYFGPEHGFRVYGLPFLVVRGYPRFQYHGYWVSAVDPWPEYWGENWYDNDDVYVSYVDNGYYLYNRRYPNAGVAISISF